MGTVTSAPVDTRQPVNGGPSRQRYIRIAALVILWLAALAIPIVLLGNDGVPEGTKVRGIDIGGLSRDDAVATVKAAFAQQSSSSISLRAANKVSKVTPADAGLSVDAEATVDSVATSRLNPFDLPALVLGGGDAELAVAVNRDALSKQVESIADRYETKAAEPEITYAGVSPRLNEGRPGTVMDKERVTALVTAAFLSGETVEVPLTDVDPQLTNNEAQEVLDSEAAHAIAGPVTLNAGKLSIPATPADLAGSLSFQVRDGRMQPQVDGEKLHERMAAQLSSVDIPAVNARWKLDDGKPVVVPSKDGSGVTDDDQLGAAVTEAVLRDGAERKAEITLGPLRPETSTEDAQALNITQKLGSHTQKFDYAPYRVNNIGLASKKINGTVLRPGDTFSLNETVGERTKAAGFQEGLVSSSGGRLQKELGGGVSAAATTMWIASFYAGLETVERGAHTFYIPAYKPGFDATVFWGYLDMKFRNNTPNGVYITTKMTSTSFTATLWGTKPYDVVKAEFGPRENIKKFGSEKDAGKECIAQDGRNGFDITVTRVLSKAGQADIREPIRSSYVASPKVRCVPQSELDPPQTAQPPAPPSTLPAAPA